MERVICGGQILSVVFDLGIAAAAAGAPAAPSQSEISRVIVHIFRKFLRKPNISYYIFMI